MSSKKYAAPLRLELQASRMLSLTLLVMHCVTLLCVYLTPLPLWSQLILSGVIVFSLLHTLFHYALRSAANAIVAIFWDENNQWQLVTQAGESMQAMLCADSYIHPKLMVLNFKRPGRWGSQSVVIPPDGLAGQTLRQLRVRLKMTSRKNPEL